MTMTRLAKTVVEPTAKNGFIFTLLGTKWGFLWLWLLIINAAAFLAYGLDKLLAKLKARHEKGPPPAGGRNLLLLAIVGGGIGAWLGMEVFRHKTQHRFLPGRCTSVHLPLAGHRHRRVSLFQRVPLILFSSDKTPPPTDGPPGVGFDHIETFLQGRHSLIYGILAGAHGQNGLLHQLLNRASPAAPRRY